MPSSSSFAFRVPISGGSAATTITGPLSGFGEVETVSPSPTSQVDFVNGVNPLTTTTRAYGTGAAVTTSNGEVLLASGTQADGYARVFASRVVNYRPGQGTLLRATARFGSPVAGNTQSVGAYNAEAGYRFGYVGTVFGIIHTETGTREVQTLTVTVAPVGGGNVTVTLDGGPAVVVPVTASGSTSICASEIAAANYGTASGGWGAQAVANVVYFTRRVTGPAGASTFAAGATGTVAAFAILTTGVVATNTFIPQSSWNVDTMDGGGSGSNPSGVLLNPLVGNVYQIQFQYLGYGAAFFGIENSATGKFTPVHIIQNANKRTATTLRNPSCYVTWENANTGGTTSTTLVGASGMSGVEGQERFLGPQRGFIALKTAPAATETPILSLRATLVNPQSNRASTGQIQFDRVSVACDGTKTVAFKVYKNATLTGAVWAWVDNTNSIALVESSATAATGGTLIYAFSVAKTGNVTENLTDLATFLQAGETVTITAVSANQSDLSAAFVWVED